jgi:hypothetical protein
VRLTFLSGCLIALTLGLLGCDAIPPFPGTGPPPRTAAPTSPPATPTSPPAAAPTPQSASTGPPATATAPAPVAGGSAATPTSPPPSGPLATLTAIIPGGLPTSIANAFDRSTPGAAAAPAPTAPAAAPAPGTGAESPEAAVQRAYEAAANGDDQALKDVTDPEVRRNPLRLMEALGRTGRKLTLIDLRYQTTANDGTKASVHVTGTIGNIPLVGERKIDEDEAAKKLGNAWYITRSDDSVLPRR